MEKIQTGIIGDLHCHSRHSDGSATVASLVDYATRLGLSHIALTDHDTMSGVEEFCTLATAAGLTAIPAVECSTRDYRRNRPVHLLCYCPYDPALLRRELDKTLAARAETKWAMVEKIQELYPIARKDVRRYSDESASVYESHIMLALADLGYTGTVIGSLMDELIGIHGSCHIPVPYPDVHDIAKLIRAAGGVAVVAHPGQFDSLEVTEELARDGLLGGIECHHPRNQPNVTEKSLALAERYDLIVTGGSDFHGQYSKHPHPPGACVSDEKNLRKLIAAAEKIHNRG